MIKKKFISEIYNSAGVKVYASPLCDNKRAAKACAAATLKTLEEDYYIIEISKVYIIVKRVL